MTGRISLSDRYRLDSRIATGGMGEVWRGTDTVLNREVAVKVLKAEYADDPAFRSRFESEARHAASLHHPNVASVFDFGEIPGDDGSGAPRPFLVMELVPGQPLSVLLHGGQSMPADTAADLVAQAAEGIAAAHALEIVHRDVKPANLLVTPEGQLKITDFGIARAADSMALTQTGQIIGTPHYLSPEQAEGRPATAASDIYALGVVLFECLTGNRPFAGDTPVTTALAHLREDVPPLPDSVPAHLRAVVGRALAKNPADRFSSATEMAAALHGDRPVTPVAPATQVLSNPTAPTGREPRRFAATLPTWLPWAGAALGVLLIIGLLSLFGGNPSTSPSVKPRDDRIRVHRADYVGAKTDVAKQMLAQLGLEATIKARTNPGGETAGIVTAVEPFGLVSPDSTITLTAWGAPVPPPATVQPSAKTSKASANNTKHGKKPHHGKPKGKK